MSTTSTVTVAPLEEKATVVGRQGASPTTDYTLKFVAAAIASKYYNAISYTLQLSIPYGYYAPAFTTDMVASGVSNPLDM